MDNTLTTRTVGNITYCLHYKKVKNINLRVRPDLSVHVSARRGVSPKAIDRFVLTKQPWILAAQARLQNGTASADTELPSDSECLAVLGEISDRIYPLFAHVLPQKPLIKVKLLKSCWGVCHPKKNYITFNKLLLQRPPAAVEYVVLHEYVHFLHPDHQRGFHDTMAKLMPDYRARRKLLR